MARFLRAGDRQGDVVLHRHLRHSALRQPDGGRNRSRRAQRLRGAGPDLSFAHGHRRTSASPKLVANQVSRQWWEEMLSPATRNHLWLTNGLATYCELLWTEHTAGAGAMESALRDVMVEALTVDNVPDHSILPPGRLLARDVGADRQQGRGRDEHAALRDRRREVLRDAQDLRPAECLEIGEHRRLSRRSRRPFRGRIWATSSSSGSNPAARRNSSSSTPSSAPRRASA